ncbi:GNAT family N-acetyltransferase [Ponticoccus sp. SC2-23]|uniref:GNAT family N-acetyltransferase n=1 Tax=Alexandriicola marinus TaxID=2081710 RepID=UPI0013DFCE50|nr:GNAT family N-acetyltransferase [Alexandriicola marinus]MBM1220489.1 GNAT family N-acetyltransferase [Ponticoccus sp. SC6-9]MBM1225175.1 GNAT family N-acetyltransferase [Ponticoccus sp. SC6-15]MBM1228689.1 GNAT family N-acetyltransferase [Ponticoccus sp. SC6-38]MBM1233674.1 GNAT family N-acetyltransferase [Ponticoccus sp. SC6-45]MBM1239190.1 GNAT family N-acetyltransferase [Ponticoccus sp. SC6-49]MBM1242972.1 GNAT family N-acetyltransferase [Ponticoccus sp. SC2-64]MBM1247198.1 GNAT family
MLIERIEEMHLTPELDREIAGLLLTAFDTEFGGNSFYKQRHHVRLTARDAGRLVGHMALCFRAIRIGDEMVDIVGLGEVSTATDRRGEGIASMLLDRAIAEARETKADFFVLFGTALLYPAAGFRAVGNPVRFLRIEGGRSIDIEEGPSSDLMVLEMRDRAWPSDLQVDLLGPIF